MTSLKLAPLHLVYPLLTSVLVLEGPLAHDGDGHLEGEHPHLPGPLAKIPQILQ